jgi:hypothetical protein
MGQGLQADAVKFRFLSNWFDDVSFPAKISEFNVFFVSSLVYIEIAEITK